MAPAATSGSAGAAESLPRQLARTRQFTLGVPGHATIAPDGNTVFFVRTRSGTDPVSCLWALDCLTWSERLIADPLTLLAGQDEELPPQEQSRRERARQTSSGIVTYAADDNCRLLAFTLSGQLWAAWPASGEVRRLPAAEPAADPRPDPTGQRIAYVSDGALRVAQADGSADLAVAVPDGPEIGFGLAEHVAAESMGRYRGYWWAPDGARLLVARVDTSTVERWHIGDPSEPARPPATIRYPAAGTTNAAVSLWIADLAAPGSPLTAVDWDSSAMEYLTSAGWDAAGPYAAVQSRDQHELTSADLDDTRRLLVGGRPVSPPGLQLEAVVAVDGDTVLFTASDEPTQTHLWAYEPTTGLRRLSSEPGVHTGTQRGGCTVLDSGHPDRLGTVLSVRIRRGSAPITSLAEEPVLRPAMELLSLGPRGLRAALFSRRGTSRTTRRCRC